MGTTLLLTAITLGFGAPLPAEAAPIAPLTIPYSTSTAEQIVRAYAQIYDVSGDEMWATTKCENPTLNPLQQSNARYANGEREKSWGNSQIHLPAHPSVTKEQAQNPYFAAEFMAYWFSKGKQRWWSCYKLLGLGVDNHMAR